MPANGKTHKDLLMEFENNQKTIKEEFNRFLETKLSITEFWGIILPFLNKLTLNREYNKILGETNLKSVDNFKFNLRDKVKSYKEYKENGDQEKA